MRTKRYSNREGNNRFPVWSLKSVFNHGAGKRFKSLWARRVRRLAQNEIQREAESFTPINRIGSSWDWC